MTDSNYTYSNHYPLILGGSSQEYLKEKLRGQDSWISRLNQEQDGIKTRLQLVEESKQALQNNGQFKESQEKFEQQISNLESDKVSLMKRLNMVLSELEKNTHEKSEIGSKLLDQERQGEDLKLKLDEVSQLKNVVNRNLQEDLRYERELNEKLRDELSRFDREKDGLLNRLKDQEEISKEIARETSGIQQNLGRKNEELRKIEREHENNLSRLRELQSQYDGMRQSEQHTKQEKNRMEDELEELSRERNDLIRRMNELSDKYEEYVTTMNRERIEIMKANKNHVKLLTAKLVFQLLTDAIQLRRKHAFQEMNKCATHIHDMEQKLYKFARIMGGYGENRTRHYLRLWYRNSMNFVHENYKKLNLIEFNVNKKRKIKMFYKWRLEFLQRSRQFSGKIDGLKRLRSLFQDKQSLSIRRYLCKWRDFVRLRDSQKDFLYSVMFRKKRRIQRLGFERWMSLSRKQSMKQKYSKMSDLVTTMWFKQKVFMGLKQAALESKTESNVKKFQAWKNWCDKARKEKYFQRKEQLVERIEGTRYERLVKQCFDAIKFGNVQQKYEDTKQQLDEEIPIRKELEKKKELLLKNNSNKDKYNLFRQLLIRVADLKFRALQIWKESVRYQSDQMQRIKLRIIDIHRKRCSKAFFKWKESIDKQHVVELVAFSEDLVNENQELQNELQFCQAKKEKQKDESKRQKGNKLERVRNMLNRILTSSRFYQWKQNTEFLVDLEDALFKTSKTIRKRKLRNGFNKMRKQFGEVKRMEHIVQKTEWFESIRNRSINQQCFEAWVQFVQRVKQAKVYLGRAIKGVDKSIKNDAVEQWKKMVFSQRKQVYVENIEELKKRQGDHENQIQELQKQIQINDSQQKHLQSKMQSQSQKIMANFIARFIHYSQAKGFFTWKEALQEFKNKRRFLTTLVNYWGKNKESYGFRKWAIYTLKSKERDLSEKLLERESERRNLQRIKQEEEMSQGNEIDELSQSLKEATQLKDQLKQNYEKALETHISRKNQNTYIDKTRNVFGVWADFIKKEKNAINVIGAIARKNLRMEVFSRIRLVAREKYLDDNANKILNNYGRLFKQKVINRAFSKWRVKNYSMLVEEMNDKQMQLEQLELDQEKEVKSMEMQKQNKAEKILKQKRQREITMQWIQMAKTMKQMRVKSEILKQNVKCMQQRWATRKWYQRVQRTKQLRRRDNKGITTLQSKTLFNCFQSWKSSIAIDKRLLQRTFKFVKRLQNLDMAHSFQQIVHFVKSSDARLKERKEQGNRSIQNTLKRIMRHKLSDALLTLKNRAFKRDFKENFLRRAFTHTITSRQRHYFGKWKHNSNRQAIADHINTEGNVVLEKNEITRKVQCLKDFLSSQGYSEEQVEKYLVDRGVQQKTNMQKAVVGFFFKNSDFQIIPKAFNQWKRWMQIRKLCKNNSSLVVNALNNPLFWAFRKWKNSEELGRQKLKELTKTELVDKIISDELAIGSAESRIGRMKDAAEHLSIQRDSLLQHFISGQKLALSLGKNNYLKTMFRSFLRWKRFTKEYEQDRLGEQLDRTNSMINDLMKHVDKLDGINRNLLDENEELRQAALDGIEIAKAVQELTREREQLSVDLQDRGSTIKKLIEDNNNLSMRLSIAQKEAEQLEQLNQQSYYAAPEREKYM